MEVKVRKITAMTLSKYQEICMWGGKIKRSYKFTNILDFQIEN